MRLYSMHVIGKAPAIRIIRMRKVMSIDATGLNMLKELVADCRKSGSKLILSGVHAQPILAMQQYGLADEIGEENIHGNIDDALDRARQILGLPKQGRPDDFVASVKREKE